MKSQIVMLSVTAMCFLSSLAHAKPAACVLTERTACSKIYQEQKGTCQGTYRDQLTECKTQRVANLKRCTHHYSKGSCSRLITPKQKTLCQENRQQYVASCVKEKGGISACTETFKTCRLTCFKSCNPCTLRTVGRCIRLCQNTLKTCRLHNRKMMRTCHQPGLQLERQCLRSFRLIQWKTYYKCLSERRSVYLSCVYQAHDQERACKAKIITTYQTCTEQAIQKRAICRSDAQKKCNG